MDEDVSGVLSTIEGKLPSADFEIGDFNRRGELKHLIIDL